MPLPIRFDWSEDEQTLIFVLQVRGAKKNSVDVQVCEVFVKVNCQPALFEADLLHEIDPTHPRTKCKVGADKVTLTLQKQKPGIWHTFRAEGSKAELRQRRQRALDAAAEREQEFLKKKDERRLEKLKAGEHEQWRLDREQVETIEKWEQEEHQYYADEIEEMFDSETKELKNTAENLQPAIAAKEAAGNDRVASSAPQGLDAKGDDVLSPSPPAVCEVTDEEADAIRAARKADSADTAIWTDADFDDTEEYMPEVRENPGKIGVRFTERPRPGVPVRDRGRRAPPLPRGTVKSELPPLSNLEGDEYDQSDPVWLKDKADNLMVNGDYQGAYNAYTEALKVGVNARAFANRAVADLFLGDLEKCIEDSTHALRILDLRNKGPDGLPHTADPEDQIVRARVEVRMGVAYLWLGAFGKAETHLQKALDVEDGLDSDEKARVKDDLVRVQRARAALVPKERADAASRLAHGGGGGQETAGLDTALAYYREATDTDPESAVVLANRCFTRLRAGQLQECLADADVAVECLRKWPCAQRAPKPPARPARLDPPILDDPTFKHPDEVKQGEVDWLMKHNGGTVQDLPELPQEYEWIRDAAEKSDDAWIAVRKKITQATKDAIKRSTQELQDAMYTRKPWVIREHIPQAKDLNRIGEGPSAKAIQQAADYAIKLEDYEKEKEVEKEKVEEELRQEVEDYDIIRALAPLRAGVGQTGFGRNHPVEKTRRRLFVKVLLRRARAFELMGDAARSAEELRTVLAVEPGNPEAKQRLAALEPAPEPAPTPAPVEAATPLARSVPAVPSSVTAAATVAQLEGMARTGGGSQTSRAETTAAQRDPGGLDDMDGAKEEDLDHSSIAALLSSAAEYMRRNDYGSALQMYNYARRVCKAWESPLQELKVLSNTSLCYQRLRGRLPELVSSCNEALRRIGQIRDSGDASVTEEMLLRMECACLSRRGSAYSQQKKPDLSAADAERVRELLARVAQLEESASGGSGAAAT